MTEEEARKKWCPMMRTVEKWEHGTTGPRNCVVNIEGDKGEIVCDKLIGCQCIASDCMMWRPTDNETRPSAPDYVAAISEPAGFCGLAGRGE